MAKRQRNHGSPVGWFPLPVPLALSRLGSTIIAKIFAEFCQGAMPSVAPCRTRLLSQFVLPAPGTRSFHEVSPSQLRHSDRGYLSSNRGNWHISQNTPGPVLHYNQMLVRN